MTDDINLQVTSFGIGAGPVERAQTLSEGDLFAERYEIVRQLGAGGMGIVYLARDRVTGEKLALKLIHPSLIDPAGRQRLIEEGVRTRRISHPNVVRIFDVGEHDGQVFLTMEHVTGRPLRVWMAEHMAGATEAPLPHVVRIVKEVLSGLSAAHGEHLVHRDIKPENIMIAGQPGTAEFSLKILDFGIARSLETAAPTNSQALGTQLYMAPEQQTAPGAVGPAADVYSVGRMLYEMLMDVLPEGTWNAPSESRADVPAALDDVIRKALQPPRARYQSAAEFAAALDAAVADTGVRARGAPVPDTAAAESRTRADVGLAGDATGAAGQWAPETPEPALKGAGTPATRPGTSRRLLYVGAAVAGVAILGLALLGEFDETAPPPETDAGFVAGRTSLPEVNVASAVPWTDDSGNVFQVSRNGDVVSGRGAVSGWGVLTFSGALNGAMAVYDASGSQVGRLDGAITDNPINGHWAGTLSNFRDNQTYPVRFHINHAPR